MEGEEAASTGGEILIFGFALKKMLEAMKPPEEPK